MQSGDASAGHSHSDFALMKLIRRAAVQSIFLGHRYWPEAWCSRGVAVSTGLVRTIHELLCNESYFFPRYDFCVLQVLRPGKMKLLHLSGVQRLS